jgi:pimeloyl-ACP methyl ester carboxylesterase
MKQQFITIGDRQLHIRRGGDGPPVILLHPSPQSSLFSLPMAKRLEKNFTVIAVDTPGYGLSDSLPGNAEERVLEDYVQSFITMLDVLGFEKAAFYGNATGAEIAHILAAERPDRVAVCMLDTAGHVLDEEVDKITDGYFPDVKPCRDGSHLLKHWDMVRSLYVYSPWQFTSEEARLRVDMPTPDYLNDKVLDYLRAGEYYAHAYKPAFYTAKHQLISRVSMPATLTRWEGKPDLKEVDDLIAAGLPENFSILNAGPTMDERLSASEQYLLDNYLTKGKKAGRTAPQIDPNANRLQKMFIQVNGGQMLAQVCMMGTGRPLLALHSASGSSEELLEYLRPFVGFRPVIAIDNPSSGESDDLLRGSEISVRKYANYALNVLDTLEIDEVDVVGLWMGGQVAIEMATLYASRVKHIVMVGAQLYSNSEVKDLLDNYTPSIAPQWDGGHLLRAWSMVRDMNLYWPWYNRVADSVFNGYNNVDPVIIDSRVKDLLKVGDLYQKIHRCSFTYPTAEKLAALKTPTLIMDDVRSPIYDKMALISLIAPNCILRDLPDSMDLLPNTLEEFFAL